MKQEYLDFFNEIVNKVKCSINVSIPIVSADHDQIKGHENALGICHGYKSPGKNDWEPEKITIDKYFIEECYEAEVNGKWYMLDLNDDKNLIDVICHEIAHIYEWRHGKKHRELTQRLISLVEVGKPHGIKSLSA